MSNVWRTTSVVLCLVSDVTSLISDVWCQTSNVRHLRHAVGGLMSYVRCQTSDVSCQTYDIWWQTSDVRRLICDVGGLMSDVWCLTFDVWHLMSDNVWCLMSDVWYLMSDVWCQTSGVPNNTTCANNLSTSGISMHQFPKNWKTRALYVRSLQYTTEILMSW